MSVYRKTYRLWRHGHNLLAVRGTVGQKNVRPTFLRLLVDTGASYTILPSNAVERVGCDTDNPLRYQEIISARGKLLAPVVRIAWLNCAGQLMENFEVLAYDLPRNLGVDGVLGMDFLVGCGAVISAAEARVYFGRIL